MSKEIKEIHFDRLLLGRKPGELLKLQGRLDSLDSDKYKSKVANQLPNFLEGPAVTRAKFYQAPVPRKVPFSLYQKAKEELNRMLEEGVISRVENPTNCCPWWSLLQATTKSGSAST